MAQEMLIVTGMSGAGRSTVAHALEDLGWYVVDNLPPALLTQLMAQSTGSESKSFAVVVDVLGGKFFAFTQIHNRFWIEIPTSLSGLNRSSTCAAL